MSILRSLNYLQEVAKTQSINKAADNLYISKSALSTAIKNLETELEVPLLNRSVQGVTLTEAGIMVVERASLIFNILNGMRDECRNYTGAQSEITFFMEDSFANSIFPQIMLDLKQTYPSMYVAAYSVNFKEIFDEVQSEAHNVGLFLECGWVRDILQFPDVELYHIASFELCVVTAKYSKHVPMNVTSLSYEELNNIPQIELLTSTHSYKSWNIPGERGRKYTMTTDNNNIFFQAILNDLGVGEMLKMNVPFGLTDRNKLRFIPMKDAENANLWMICNKNLDADKKEQLISVIRTTMTQ